MIDQRDSIEPVIISCQNSDLSAVVVEWCIYIKASCQIYSRGHNFVEISGSVYC